MFDRLFLESKITELTSKMDEKEKFLKYAKEQEVRLELNKEITILSLQRDIYINLL